MSKEHMVKKTHTKNLKKTSKPQMAITSTIAWTGEITVSQKFMTTEIQSFILSFHSTVWAFDISYA